MSYLDYERLESIDVAAYRARDPYPWANPADLLRPEAFEALYENLPDVALFQRFFGKQRKAGQRPHDRFVLEYHEGLAVPKPWVEFIAELSGRRYRRAMCRLFGVRTLAFNFHWHYTPNGCSVSPHCDSTRKLGSHIFYFNTEKDWDASWGGETVVLDDGGRFDPKSAPDFDDFDSASTSEAMGNRSLLFTRRGNSWHGVREIRCPEGRMRKVFIVVVNRNDLKARVKRLVSGKEIDRY